MMKNMCFFFSNPRKSLWMLQIPQNGEIDSSKPPTTYGITLNISIDLKVFYVSPVCISLIP